MRRREVRTLRRVFGVPIVLAVFSMVGLLAALFGDGAYDVSSWLLLAVPVLVALRALLAGGRDRS